MVIWGLVHWQVRHSGILVNVVFDVGFKDSWDSSVGICVFDIVERLGLTNQRCIICRRWGLVLLASTRIPLESVEMILQDGGFRSTTVGIEGHFGKATPCTAAEFELCLSGQLQCLPTRALSLEMK